MPIDAIIKELEKINIADLDNETLEDLRMAAAVLVEEIDGEQFDRENNEDED